MRKKSKYNGVPQNVLINSERNYTIVFEELDVVKVKDSVSHTLIRNTAVVTYNPEGEILSSYLVPVEHYAAGISITPFYQSQRELTGQLFYNGCQYKTSAYLSDWHNSFVLLNDKKSNITEALKGNISSYKEMVDDDSFFSLLTGNEVVPARQYIFGQPKAGVEQNRALFTVYDYDMANNLLVLLKQGKESGRSGVRLVWLQP